MSEELKRRIEAIVGKHGFERALAGMELVEIGGGRARARLAVDESVQNPNGKLHGGAVATLVDAIGTVAIMTADAMHRPGVTTDLNVSYFAPGEGVVTVDATVLKTGRTLAFVSVDVRREDGRIVAQGRMTKHLGS